MKKFETLVFDQDDADKVGGVEALQKQYEAQGFLLVENDPETLGKLYPNPEDGIVVLIMDREVPAPIDAPRPTAVWPRGRGSENKPLKTWQTPITEEALAEEDWPNIATHRPGRPVGVMPDENPSERRHLEGDVIELQGDASKLRDEVQVQGVGANINTRLDS